MSNFPITYIAHQQTVVSLKILLYLEKAISAQCLLIFDIKIYQGYFCQY